MNRIPLGLNVLKAHDGFLQFKAAEGVSNSTLNGYGHYLKIWGNYIGDVDVARVTSQHLLEFLNWMRNDYKPRRFSGKEDPLSPKTLRNIWVCLSAFFTWPAGSSRSPTR